MMYSSLPLTLILTFLSSFPSALAAPVAPTKRAITPITDGSLVNGKTYDYVVVGGGLAGSVLASRLTEDAGRTVLMIEAGFDQEGNTGVTDASQYQSTFGSSIDWAYQTTPQASSNAAQTIRAGKALGGSTTINGLAWSKPHTFQIDAMETLGNPGLNWNSLQGYMLQAENFQAPSSSQVAAGVTFSAGCRGSGGPIGTQYDPNSTPSNLEHDFNTTVLDLGLPYATDLTCGDPAGAAPIANTRNGGLRIDAYRGYLYGKTRPNLTILTGATVGKVLFTGTTATGVQFQDQSSTTYSVSSRLEIIMAAGSIKTPVILQQSGLGPANVLSAAGVTQLVDLPVGLGLIDQTTTTTDWSFKGSRGGGQPITFPRFQDLVTGSDKTTMTNMLNNDLASYAQANVAAGAAQNATALEIVLAIQRDWILNQGAGMSENFDYSFDSTLGYDSWYLLPFGRGSIKITNNQAYATNNFNINPRYFTNAFDRLAQGATARFTRTVSTTAPLKNDVTGESVPGGSVAHSASLDAWATWAEGNYRSNWHPIGTAAMMSRSLGGVVDVRNRVYGVSGLRVVDGSLLPFQVSSHLMTVLYGLAERAAALIKQDHPTSTTSSSSSSSRTSTTSTSSASSTTSSSGPVVTGRAIHPNGDTTKCLDVPGSLSNGAKVDIYDCSSTRNQKWVIAKGETSVKLAGTNFCLDAGSNLGNGVQMKVWTCYTGLTAQTWYFTDDNYIAVENQGQCLDLTNGVKTNGNIVQTWACSSNNNNQKWTV